MNERILAWEGSKNARDLGGLRTLDGRLTRCGAIVRGDSPSRLTPAGWASLYGYGIRTIITLCTLGLNQPELNFHSPYPDIDLVRMAIEDLTDKEFLRTWAMTNLWCTPLYYKDALRRWPERHAAVISAIAQAKPGGVLFHCRLGYGRTGIIALLLLALVGVTPEAILADYELSVDPERDEILKRENSSIREALLGSVEGLDLDGYLCKGGASPDDLAAVRQRLVD